MPLLNQPPTQVEADEAGISCEHRLRRQRSEHCVEMASLAVGARSHTKIPGQAGSHVLKRRLKDLRSRRLFAGAAKHLLVFSRARSFEPRTIYGVQHPTAYPPDLSMPQDKPLEP